MNITVLGLNHLTAPITVREKLSFPKAFLCPALSFLRKSGLVKEAVIVSTCNRVEIYALSQKEADSSGEIINFLSEFHETPSDKFQNYLYSLSGHEALKHLFRVSSSLDSQVIGESQILGQIKDAYFQAKEAGSVSRVFSFIFEEAIKTGKRVRSHTQIGCGAVSISSAAVEMARKIFGDLRGKRILVIGAGKISELSLKHLYDKGADMVFVANRTFLKAQKLAEKFKGTALDFERFPAALGEADIVISSAEAPHFLVTKKMVMECAGRRKQQQLFLIDLGLPRNIDPEVNSIDNVYVYNLDDLKNIKDANFRERLKEVQKIEKIIDEKLLNVEQRLNALFNDACGEKEHCYR